MTRPLRAVLLVLVLLLQGLAIYAAGVVFAFLLPVLA